MMTGPEDIEQLIAGYALGNLTPEEELVLQQRLSESPELLNEVAQLQAALGLLTLEPTAVTPPPRVREAIFAALEPPRRQTLPWGWGIAGVAALVVAVVGFDNYQVRQQLALNESVTLLLQKPDTQLVNLQSPTGAQTTGKVLVQEKAVFLTIQNLPPLPGNQTYHLWAITGGTKISLYGRFNTRPGVNTTQFAAPEGVGPGALVIAITAEAGPVTTPQGPKVLISS
ncbi:anti-sigma factor domain-containing protein [Candidatus Cyanaurora vandensis]|uniref:anti-sigma factor n=1 Tax=Candidatus Cyanaurora vandensis TaxID=2714958 RepID=UPI00257E1B8A|nr:anti-sigma factor [Candidatus Cyanaurora vandensis]